MRENYLRHLGTLFTEQNNEPQPKAAAIFPGKKAPVQIPPEFNAKDWMTLLLHIDAELEHSLMVQYLYAAYSLGGDLVATGDRGLVRGWQEVILGIAKEEMGHFVSIQNVLRVIGAPLNFNRQDFPWDSELYPFEFKLEPLSLFSLAKYIYAESPADWLTNEKGDDAETKEIKKEIKQYLSADKHGDPIGVLFKKIINILEDNTLIPDEVFLPETYPYQAKFGEWGRGYAGGARGNSTNANPHGAPDVLVTPLGSRTETINAIKKIAEQGEATSAAENERSHFGRFLGIYKEWRRLPESFKAARNLAINPDISALPTDSKSHNADAVSSDSQIDLITNPEAKQWANLFNVRYRMLLTFLTHSFLIADGFESAGTISPRGAIIHASFGEMYNLRSIANVLVNMPVAEGSDKMAGPPFLIPYSMDLPIGERNRWRLHCDLLEASGHLIDGLLETADTSYQKYLYALRDTDKKLNDIAMKIIGAAV